MKDSWLLQDSVRPVRANVVSLRPEADRLAAGRPKLQLADAVEVPALYFAERGEEASLLLHQRGRAHLAGAARRFEAQRVIL